MNPTKTENVRPENVNAAVQWLVQNHPLLAKHLTVWDTHKDKLSQPPPDQNDNSTPAGISTISCFANTTGDSNVDVQGLVLPSGRDNPVLETQYSATGLEIIVAGYLLPRVSCGPSPGSEGEVKRACPVYYDPHTGNASDLGHCMEMLRSVHMFPFGRGG